MVKWLLSAVIALLLIGLFGFYNWPQGATPPEQQANVDVQIGFYDLMSRRKETYDTHMEMVNHTILTTITSPDDPRFILKGKFTQISTHQRQQWFSWSPIYYNAPNKGLMIDGMVDLMMNMDIWMQPITLAGQPLVVGQSGIIFLYPSH
ncbi:hypothetical protein RI049_17695 [Cedecea neteri]|uniref:hypothetical protein n=1 Tax=Cedecea neteri TaxID=158822 RepID=UPI000698CF1C|nr:hypothetical protein [Cedecea neteri]WPU21871.1 hypothetical protein RI049_17695 [Cedecea neteri]